MNLTRREYLLLGVAALIGTLIHFGLHHYVSTLPKGELVQTAR
jgi:hypothetical protein